jgi:hypothetical protein
MKARSVAFSSFAIAVGAVLLAIALRFPGDSGAAVVPNPSYGGPENAVATPNLLVHYYRPPTTGELSLSIALSVATLSGVSILVARYAATRRLLTGTSAAVASAVLALVVATVTAQKLPRPQTIFIGTIGSLAVGMAAAWIASRWWPNKSLERTRDR